jgi:hypothetical protein
LKQYDFICKLGFNYDFQLAMAEWATFKQALPFIGPLA